MSEHGKYAWASLAASVLVWAFFAMRMTEGGLVAEVSARQMLWTYTATVVLMAVSHSIIAAVLAVRLPGIGLKDERDLAIESRADRIEGYVLAIAINAVIIQALADAGFGGHSMPRVELESLPTLRFALLTTLFVGHVVKQAVTIWSYRT